MSSRRSSDQVLGALYEEYRALYGLVVFRMTALDRRAPVTAGALVAAVAAVDVLPAASQQLVLLGLPVALVWFVRTTVNHARSFEDVLRRLEAIERAANAIVGCRAMRFQSSHPSRGRQTGGRTGRESVAAVVATTLFLLAAAGWQVCQNPFRPAGAEVAYGTLLGLVTVLIVREVLLLRRYRYTPAKEPNGSHIP